MRLNLIIDIPEGTEFGALPILVQQQIAKILVGEYTPTSMPGTQPYNGRSRIQAQVDTNKDTVTTVAQVEGMFDLFGLDWTVVAAQEPHALVNIGTEENPIMKNIGVVPIPDDMVNFLKPIYDKNTDTFVTPPIGYPVTTNAGDDPWAWAST